ncbi:putative T7SS-secreted protein [Gandjariella thermophila]|uniref:Putative T7SS secretion signal domain-containing protein n=1 Tax=Gandjariella thermophila TaxID=1931992 RepID=A0A4D4JHD0_9PSEU|nr:hypothetical protein [Gandjariella thermophila]GDY34048.1 hypothetical protein GTS_56810 [Gandjariella thermophila]
MTAELGQTNDPKALIPGDPASVQDIALLLRTYGDALHEAGAGLQRIDTTDGWSGQAADAFREVFHGQPSKWLEAGDCFHEASQAMGSYATTLTWAQAQAQEAIQQWNEAQAATKAAQEQHARDVEHAHRDAQARTAAGNPTVAPDIPFVDPGEAKRQAAKAVLDRARGQLTSAGNTAGQAIGKARDKAPPKPSLLDRLGDTLGDAASDAWHGVEKVGAEAINDLASLGNAAIHHPGDIAGMVGGSLLTVASAAGEAGGFALDATGVGSVAGVPLNAVSAAGMATGAGIAGAAVANMAMHAGGDDHVEPVKSDSSSGSGGGGDAEAPFPPPKEINGLSEHGEARIMGRDGHGVSDEAMHDAVNNPTRAPEYRPDQYGGTYRYKGKDAVVVLNEEGKVVTAWARGRGGWRNP